MERQLEIQQEVPNERNREGSLMPSLSFCLPPILQNSQKRLGEKDVMAEHEEKRRND